MFRGDQRIEQLILNLPNFKEKKYFKRGNPLKLNVSLTKIKINLEKKKEFRG